MTDPEARLDAEAQADDEAKTEAAATTEPEEAAATTAAVDETTPEEPAAPVPADTPSPAAEKRERRPRPRRPAPPAPLPLAPYAIIETGGKQYRVSVGDRVSVEKLTLEAGSDVTFDRVLLLGGTGTPRVGTPTVAGASVTAKVEDHYRGEKIVVFKYKPKKRYRRRLGHRQSLTRLAIVAIDG